MVALCNSFLLSYLFVRRELYDILYTFNYQRGVGCAFTFERRELLYPVLKGTYWLFEPEALRLYCPYRHGNVPEARSLCNNPQDRRASWTPRPRSSP